MSTHIKILSQQDVSYFEFPPQFNGDERKKFFVLSEWIKILINKFKTPTNKIGFILQFGYFKAVNRFFTAKKYNQKDIEYIANKLNINFKEVDFTNYVRTTFERHQELILETLGFQKFNSEIKTLLTKESLRLCQIHLKPKFIFMSLIDFLKSKKIQIPSYNALSEIITESLRNYEKRILQLINDKLSRGEKDLLDKLLKVDDNYEPSKLKVYKVTLLKKINHSTKPSRIKENVNDLQCLREIFLKLELIIKSLNLSPEVIQYFSICFQVRSISSSEK